MIFGDSYCKLSGSVVVNLEHSDISPSYIISNEEEHKSILSGHKNYIYKKHYSAFNININLFKYEDSASVIMNDLLKLKNEEFYFYPHVDGSPVVDIYNKPIKFHMSNITPYYLTSDNIYDSVRVDINSIDFSYLNVGLVITNGYGYDYGLYYGLTGW